MRHFSNDLATRALLVVGIASVVVAAECIAAEAAAGREVPPGAAALGYTKCVIDERPSVADISFDNTGNAKWFNGLWCTPPAPRGKFEMVDGVLAIHPDGVLTSAPRDFSPRWRLPPLPGKDGFYVEFDVRLSDNDHDHWPAVWLMPIGTDQKNGSHYESDPPGRTRYMELDVDEGSMCPGMAGTVHSWIWRDGRVERHRHNPNNLLFTPLDRTKMHTFGASYDPTKTTVTWWLDGVKQMSATKPYCPEIAAKQNFYFIMNANYQHKKELDYRMFINAVRAYVPPASSLPGVPAGQGRKEREQ